MLPALAALNAVLTIRAPTTALPALAALNAVLTNRAPTTALRALAARLSVLAVVELNHNTLGVHAPLCFPPTPNIIGLLPPHAAIMLLKAAIGALAHHLAVKALHLARDKLQQTQFFFKKIRAHYALRCAGLLRAAEKAAPGHAQKGRAPSASKGSHRGWWRGSWLL